METTKVIRYTIPNQNFLKRKCSKSNCLKRATPMIKVIIPKDSVCIFLLFSIG